MINRKVSKIYDNENVNDLYWEIIQNKYMYTKQRSCFVIVFYKCEAVYNKISGNYHNCCDLVQVLPQDNESEMM